MSHRAPGWHRCRNLFCIVSLIMATGLTTGCANWGAPREPGWKAAVRHEIGYIATADQLALLSGLAEESQLAEFIEGFWAEWDPTPETPENEFRFEFDQRLEIVKIRYPLFASGQKSDRARVYLKYGPPLDSHHETKPSFYLTTGIQIKQMEIWIYPQRESRTGRIRPTVFDNLYPTYAKFVFADLDGYGRFIQLYSSVAGEKTDPRAYNMRRRAPTRYRR